MLTVPKHWEGLSHFDIARKLLGNEGLIMFIATEVKRCLDNPDEMDPKVIGQRLIDGNPIGS